MLSASSEFRNAFAESSKAIAKAVLTFADGTVRDLTGDDLMMSGLSVTDSTSSSGSFDIGAAVVGSLAVRLNNYDGRFDGCDFTDAVIEPYVGKELSGGREWLRKGVFNVEQPETYGTVIGLSCADNLSKLQQLTLADANLSWPLTAQLAVQGMCDKAQLTLATSTFANDSYILQQPEDDTISMLQALSCIAQATGNHVRCDNRGRVRVDWYDADAVDLSNTSTFDDVASAFSDTAGTFAVVSTGSNGADEVVSVSAVSSLSVGTDDVVVTGIRVTAQNEVVTDSDGNTTNGEDGETALEGSEGYVLEISGNPFVPYGSAAEVAKQVGAQAIGLTFRAFDASAIGDPCAEAGDPVILTDGQGRAYSSFITSLTYKVGAYETFACSAEPPARNSAKSASAVTQAYVKAHNEVKREKTRRELALSALASELAESNGLYRTNDEQEDGSTVYYLHDKPTLAESKTVIKLNANALGLSTDGGETYPYIIDVNGDAILNRIYAIGLDADYITTGRITAKDQSGNVVNFIDLDTGEMRIASTAAVGDSTVASKSDVDDAANGLISSVDVLYGTSAASNIQPTEWQTEAPTWVDGIYIWSKTVTTKGGQTSETEPVCITGPKGVSGEDGKSGYVHVAWVKSITGSELKWGAAAGDFDAQTIAFDDAAAEYEGFSTTDSTDAVYLGAYTDYEAEDSQVPGDYEWSLIKGASVTITAIEYAASTDGDTEPTEWQTSIPALEKGTWLWVRTTYSDASLATTKSYVGTDGEDGKSVSIVSTSKADGITTVLLSGGDGTTQELSIADGQDGDNGVAGANGANSYIHIAWATSADGSDGFSTSASSGKTYIGIYADDTEADSTDPSAYSWSLIKGDKGDTGTGVSAIQEQYYLSTSDTLCTGGAWSTAQPEWESGHCIWTRSSVTWTDGTTTYTTPQLAKAINGANTTADAANDTADAAKSASDANTATLANLQTQEAIFNLLTNDGELQGLYMQDGKLYINAEYIVAGILRGAGVRTKQSSSTLLDSSSSVTVNDRYYYTGANSAAKSGDVSTLLCSFVATCAETPSVRPVLQMQTASGGEWSDAGIADTIESGETCWIAGTKDIPSDAAGVYGLRIDFGEAGKSWTITSQNATLTNYTLSYPTTWDMATGKLKTEDITATGQFTCGSTSSGLGMQMKSDGTIVGFHDGSQVGVIDTIADISTWNSTSGKADGLRLQGDIVAMDTDLLSVRNSSSGGYIAGVSGDVNMTLKNSSNDNTILQLSFMRGLCTAIGG